MLDFFWLNLQNIWNSFLQWWFVYVILIIIGFLIARYTDKDFFGLRIVTGDFGSGKTYNNSLTAKDFSTSNIFIISNIRNSFTDLVFDSPLDLQRIFAFLMKYAEITNNKEFIEIGFKPIAFNIDEAHNYFFSRNFTNNIDEKQLMVTTQVRKRDILINFLTQQLAQLDVFFRRLSGGLIQKYYSGFGFIRYWKLYYVANPEETNLEDETVSKVVSKGFYLAPHFLTFISKKRRSMLPEKRVSRIIVGFTDMLNDYSFTDFLRQLYPIDTEHGKAFWSIYKSKYGDKEFLKEYNDRMFLLRQKEEIEERYKEVLLANKKKAIKKYENNF